MGKIFRSAFKNELVTKFFNQLNKFPPNINYKIIQKKIITSLTQVTNDHDKLENIINSQSTVSAAFNFS